MKKYFLLFLSMLILSISSLVAKTVDVNTAKTVAVNYFNHQSEKIGTHYDASAFDLVFTEKSISDLPVYYVFNVGNKQGFIIISGDDDALPVLGYSTEAGYDPSKVNITFDKWMNSYKQAILFIVEHDIKANQNIKTSWANLKANQFSQAENSAVPALCNTQWDQSPFVNDACPLDADVNKRCVTGCPATAMAQVLKYWNQPFVGTGSHSYQHPKYGTLSANYGNTIYDFPNMPDLVTDANPAVAKLMSDCGIAVNMQYTPESSGGYVIINSPEPEANCEYAYKTYFGFKSTLQGLERENFTDVEWIEILKAELDASRPMQYAGFGGGGGHTFVCDGYDDNMMFHINWGWGGVLDGFFAISALNPGTGGIGSGTGTYNMSQQAIVGIEPSPLFSSSAPKYGLAVNSAISVSQAPIISETPLTVNVAITYDGSANHITDLAAIMFTEDGVFVEVIDEKSNITFVDGISQNFSFASPTGVGGIPGKHIIGIYSAEPTDSTWSLIKQASFTNPVPVLLSGVPNTLKISDQITISNTPLYVNDAFTVIGSVTNTGTDVFTGNIAADVFTAAGDFVINLEEKTGITIEPGATLTDIIFNSAGLDLEPGSYFIAWFSSSDLVDYPIISNELKDNPISFDLLETPIGPDGYEDNNVLSSSYNVPLNFTADVASFKSTGSNIHFGDDIDYYKLALQNGYSYVITARVHDEYSSGDGNEYTNDVFFTFNTGNGQSEHIDDVLLDDIALTHGGSVYFRVSPFYNGFTGTYALDLTISRTLTVGTNIVANDNDIVLYPVPASNAVAIDLKNSNVIIEKIRFQNAYGQVVSALSAAANEINVQNIDVSTLPNGMYFMVIEGNNQKFIKKLIINR
jgi:hypothetical protein